MRRTRLRLVLACLASAMLGASFFAPAAAAQTDVDSARSAIWAEVQAADARNQQILNQFTADALASTSMDDLVKARDTAHWELDVVWYQAVEDIEAIEALFPDELAADADAALAGLVKDHDAAHAEVERLYDMIAGGVGTTTTSTTTTTRPTTTTTKPPSVSTTTTTKPPRTTTTTRPATTTSTTSTTRPDTSTTTTSTSTTTTVVFESPATTTTTRADTTTTTEAGGAVPPGGGTGTPGIGDDPALGGDAIVAASTAGADADQAMMSDVRAERTPASHMLMHTASVLLPPGIVEFAVSPFMAVEFLLWTLVEAIGSMLLPFLVLMAAVAWTAWREIRRPAITAN